MMLPLFGLGLAPLFVAGVLRLIEWRLVFLIFVIPGLLLAFSVWRTVPISPRRPAIQNLGKAGPIGKQS